MGVIIGFLVVVVVIVLWAIGIFNRLVGLRVRCDNAWSDVDVQLKRRYDLIPNLVETVKGYAAHEKSTFEEVTKWRNAAMNASAPADKAQAENMLTGALKSLFAVAEAYPQLRAAENFQQLQKELDAIEDAIQNSRRYYNAVVRDYNTLTQMFPSSMIANFGNFKQRDFFELTSAAEREAPKVQFT